MGLIDLQAGHPLCIGASMSQTCVMLTVLAPKPNPLLASARRAMAVVQIRAWARIRLQCGRLVKQCYTLPVICGARPYAPEKTIAPYSITPRTITGVN